MKWSKILLILAVVGGAIMWAVGKNNQMVELKAQAQREWANVESAYQRRLDLIGNLVKTVQGAADFERKTLTDVIEARSKATSVNVDASNLTPENLQQFQQAQSGLSSALSRLLVSVERYPELRANQNFLQLQSQIEGTENRIDVGRKRYNDAVTNYNVYVQKIPNNMIASFFNHQPMPLFKAEEGAEKAPNVEFKFD